MCDQLLSRVQLFVTPWTVASQAPLSMEFSKQEYWSGLPFHSPEDLPNPGRKPRSPTLQAGSLLTELSGKPNNTGVGILQYKIKSFVLFLKSPFSFHPASWNVDGLTADHDWGHERGRNKIKRAYSSYLPTSVLLTSGVSHSWKNLILIGINHTSQW